MIATLIAFAVNMGINFFLSPYIISNVGMDAYGFVTLANNFVMYASLITIALNSMASRFITVELYRNNKEEANEKMQISTRRDLLQEASNIGDLKRYNMMLQNISIAPNVKNYLNNNRTTPK